MQLSQLLYKNVYMLFNAFTKGLSRRHCIISNVHIYGTLSAILSFIVEIVTAIIVVLGILVINQYTILSFPPRQCVEGGRNFYNYIVAANIIFAAGLIMLVVIAWNIHKVGFYVMSPPSVTKEIKHAFPLFAFLPCSKRCTKLS